MTNINAIRKTPDVNGIYEYLENVRSSELSTTNWEFDPDVTTLEAANIPQKHWKFVAPDVVEMSDAEKLAANKSLLPEHAEYMYVQQQSGRFYCYTDNRWISSSDDNYGSNYYQFAESGGKADNPVIEWEHQGVLMDKGETVRRLTFNARSNNNEVTDFNIRVYARFPTNPDKWRTGLSGDANMTNELLLDDMFMNPVDTPNWDLPFTGNMKLHHRRTINLDYQMPADGWLSLYIKPKGIIKSTRYIMSTFRYDIININEETSA
jgi:hypothetical protein